MGKLSTSRRNFLKAAGMGAATLAISDRPSAKTSYDDLVSARKKAAHRKRRIIMNDDGGIVRGNTPEDSITPESFLKQRTSPLIGTQVDAIFYNTFSAGFTGHSHLSEETELVIGRPEQPYYTDPLLRQGKDPLEIVVNFCRSNGMEIFWSERMNDNHDVDQPWFLTRWKNDHPEYLMGTKGQKFPYGWTKWTPANYAIPDVRDKVFRIIQDVAIRYDIDGIELDFFRHLHYFKPQMLGEPVTQEHCDMMTGLLRRIRKVTDDVAVKRGRPMLIAVRTPDSVGFCKAIGLDIIRWMEDDLIDIITGGGYFHLEPWENLVALGKRYDITVYATMIPRRIKGDAYPEKRSITIKRWRGEALNAWKAGVDGLYTFNLFDPNDSRLYELGDPELLKTLDSIDQENYARADDPILMDTDHEYLNPGGWLKGGMNYICP